MIKHLSNSFKNYPIGYSDHTNGIASPLYSIAVGSRIIEKHFKIDEDCVDASVSIGMDVSKKMITEIRKIERSLCPIKHKMFIRPMRAHAIYADRYVAYEKNRNTYFNSCSCSCLF